MEDHGSSFFRLIRLIRILCLGWCRRRSADPLVRFEWLVACGRVLLPRYRFKWPQIAWWDESWFNDYLGLVDESDGMNTDRRWNLSQFLRLITHVDGDTVECGCYRGASSFLICRSNAQEASRVRVHYIFDSFEGLSEPLPLDGNHWTKHALSASEGELHKTLKEFSGRYVSCRGWIPNRFAEVATKRFAFVHIDVDIYEPTRDSIAFFYERMSPNGILLCDDYGFTTCPGATRAIDEFLGDKPEKMIALSCGGGFFIKGVPTGPP